MTTSGKPPSDPLQAQTTGNQLPPRDFVVAAAPARHGLIPTNQLAREVDLIQAEPGATRGEPSRENPKGAIDWRTKPPNMHQDDYALIKRVYAKALRVHSFLIGKGYSAPEKGWGQNASRKLGGNYPCGMQAHCLATRVIELLSRGNAADHHAASCIRVLQGWNSREDQQKDTNGVTHSVMYVRIRNPDQSVICAVFDPWGDRYYFATPQNLANYIARYVEWNDYGSAEDCPALPS